MAVATESIERIAPQQGPQEAFLATAADIAIYGGSAGSGKSFALLLEPLRYIELPGFDALILRRTTKEVMNVGGLWTEAEGLYSRLGAESRIGDLQWQFPSANIVKFDHLEHEQDKYKYQGAQCPFIGFDELTRFTETQFWYLLSRNRSTCGVSPYVRATCNPDASSWVSKLIAWWIDQATGYPIAERSGIVRWFVRIGGQLIWDDTKDNLLAEFPESRPKSLTFIAAKLDDNPALTSKDPGYRANLMALPHIEQERLLRGNWLIVDNEGAEWPAEYFQDIWCECWPDDRHITVVALDPSKGKTDRSDFSAFVAVCKGHDDVYYVDAQIERIPIDKIVERGTQWLEWIKPDFFGCEFNGFQELLGPMFTERLRRSRINLYSVGGIHNYKRGVDEPRGAKVVRIRKLSGLLADGRIKLRRSRGTEILLQQLMQFPIRGVHDDGPDALEMAIRLCEELLRGSGYGEPEPEVLTV